MAAVIIASLLFFCASSALGQEVFIGGGFAANTESGKTSSQGSWHAAYFQPIADWAMFSVAYFNEGHHDSHDIMNARDGFAAQLWARAYPAKQLSAGLGIGPYLYFNTKTGEDIVECDIQHGVGVMSSGTLTWHGLSPLLSRYGRIISIHLTASIHFPDLSV